MMKKLAIIISGAILGLSVLAFVQIGWNLLHQQTLGTPDKTSENNININVLLTRPENWKKVVDEPVIDESEINIIDGSTATIPITAELLRQFWNYSDDRLNQTNIVYHSTTHNAYVNLIHQYGRRLILVTQPSEEEKQEAQDAGVELDVTPVAKDGFVFITHKDNPVDSLTVEQVQGIYTGTITNWKQLGGDDMEIRAYQREANSGSQTAMEQLVMQGKPMLSPISAKVHMGMGALVDAVAEFESGPASIGYTYYYYINNLYKNENIKVLKVDGVTPDNKNLINGSYPFSTSYYAVIRGDEPTGSPARKLRDFLITEQGQRLIEMAGYCRSAAGEGGATENE